MCEIVKSWRGGRYYINLSEPFFVFKLKIMILIHIKFTLPNMHKIKLA